MTQLQTTAATDTAVAVAETRARRTVAPAVDIHESKTEVLLVADLPGVAADGLTIEVKDGEVAIRARPAVTWFDEEPFDFARAFRVPPGVDVNGIEAELKHGVLQLRLPKAPELRPRTIPVRSA
jgi:HSP20 family protein